MPIAAGIVEILAGFWMLISVPYLVGFSETPLEGLEPHEFLFLSILIILGLLAVVGGILALIHRKWRLALAGAVSAIPLPFAIIPFAAWASYFHNILSPSIFALGFLLALSPIVLLLLSKREFK